MLDLGIVTLIITSILVILLLIDKFNVAYLFMGGAVLLVLIKAVSIEDFLGSFSNKAVLTIFLLIYLTSIIHKNLPLIAILDRIFNLAKSPRAFILQMTAVVSSFSSVMNNTPIVALFIPYVYQWGKRNNVAPSKLLIPLSYAAIFGGMITVIGTSTNLVLNGFVIDRGEKALGFSDFFFPGIIVSIAGILFLTLTYRFLLPERNIEETSKDGALRQYLTETKLAETSPLVGKSIQEAELRNLDGVYLAEIYRNGRLLQTVAPEDVLQANDRLYFAGDTENVMHVIEKFPGISWAKSDKFAISDKAEIVETVIPANSSLHSKSLKESFFREKFDSAVIGIHRNGEKLSGKLGEIPLRAGDLLLVIAGVDFRKRINADKDLYALQWVKEQSPSNDKAIIFLISVLLFIGLSIFGVVDFFMALLLSVSSAIILGLFNSQELKKQTNLDLLLILGGAITVGKAFIDTGAAQIMTAPLVNNVEFFGPFGIVLMLYLVTVVFTSFVTNVAAVSVLFPIAYELIHDLGLNPTPVYLTLAFGASAAFITPIGYQTNLMVYGPGKYTFKDFVKIGLPFTLIYSLCALITIFALHKLI